MRSATGHVLQDDNALLLGVLETDKAQTEDDQVGEDSAGEGRRLGQKSIGEGGKEPVYVIFPFLENYFYPRSISSLVGAEMEL